MRILKEDCGISTEDYQDFEKWGNSVLKRTSRMQSPTRLALPHQMAQPPSPCGTCADQSLSSHSASPMPLWRP
jgi:hypothetical protein